MFIDVKTLMACGGSKGAVNDWLTAEVCRNEVAVVGC